MIRVTRSGVLTTLRDGEERGFLRLFPDGTVEDVYVSEEWRRTGVARRLWEAAIALGLQPRHSPERTAEGDAWAKAVGGALPELSVEKPAGPKPVTGLIWPG